MGNARAAKDRKEKTREVQFRVRSGSSGRDNTGLKHESIQTLAEAKWLASMLRIVLQGREEFQQIQGPTAWQSGDCFRGRLFKLRQYQRRTSLLLV